MGDKNNSKTFVQKSTPTNSRPKENVQLTIKAKNDCDLPLTPKIVVSSSTLEVNENLTDLQSKKSGNQMNIAEGNREKLTKNVGNESSLESKVTSKTAMNANEGNVPISGVKCVGSPQSEKPKEKISLLNNKTFNESMKSKNDTDSIHNLGLGTTFHDLLLKKLKEHGISSTNSFSEKTYLPDYDDEVQALKAKLMRTYEYLQTSANNLEAFDFDSLRKRFKDASIDGDLSNTQSHLDGIMKLRKLFEKNYSNNTLHNLTSQFKNEPNEYANIFEGASEVVNFFKLCESTKEHLNQFQIERDEFQSIGSELRNATKALEEQVKSLKDQLNKYKDET